MNNNRINAQDILRAKKMEEQYQLIEISHFDLPIAQHQVVINYKARFKYTILEYQTLRFIATAQNAVRQEDIVAALGISNKDIAIIYKMLMNDNVIEANGKFVTMTVLGEQSFNDGYSPLRQEMLNFDFYYEPISSYVVADIQHYRQHVNPSHPIIYSENYHPFACPLVSESEIIDFYESNFDQSLTKNTKDFNLISFQHEGVDTSYYLPVQNLQLFELEKGVEIRSLWNAKNQRFIHLA